MNLDYAAHQDASFEKDHWWPRARFRLIDRVVSRFPPDQPLEVLEVGCGTGINLGYTEERYSRRLTKLVGVEPGHPLQQEGIRTIQPDLPAEDLFDVILLMDVLEHLDDPGDVLKKLNRRLKPAGILLVTVPAFSWLWTAYDEVAHHCRRYSLPELRVELRSAGFHIVENFYLFGLLFPAFVLQRLTLKALPRRDPHLLKPAAPWVNRLLTAIMRWEMQTLMPLNHVAGSSAVGIAQRL